MLYHLVNSQTNRLINCLTICVIGKLTGSLTQSIHFLLLFYILFFSKLLPSLYYYFPLSLLFNFLYIIYQMFDYCIFITVRLSSFQFPSSFYYLYKLIYFITAITLYFLYFSTYPLRCKPHTSSQFPYSTLYS